MNHQNNNHNIFDKIDIPHKGELFETLLQKSNIIIKRIVSSHIERSEIITQDEEEWFILVEGSATLKIEEQYISLKRGDYYFLKAKQPHQILHVEAGTIWLAVYIDKQ